MFRKEMMDIRWRVLVFFVVFGFLLVGTIALRPFIGELLGASSKELAQLPDFLKNIVGDLTVLNRMEADDEFYLLSQWQGKNMGQFLPLCVLLLVFPLFSREEEKKTLYFLLARFSRQEIYWKKILASFSAVFALLFVFTIAAPASMNLAGYNVGFQYSFLILLQQVLASWFFFGFFVFLSVVFRDQIKPVLWGILFALALPMASLYPPLSWMNPYPYLLGTSVLQTGRIDGVYSMGMIVFGTALIVAASIIFEKKEF
ncbi:MAG: ABC transporter permease [Thermotogaceae bacterium]|nr:ABC transporter permease [Thermotogota bacterium]MDD8041546.1 ABC transporter permease subunit [Thermotogota bacterium]NLZ13269.1 ABC transporter permease [Thermotogaceae bacterium]HQQ64515.1 ABC transporter permease subunit [Thermotogota bacterium]